MLATSPVRTFKTGWFARAARKAHIGDAELCEAIAEAMAGQVDDIGGAVFKKRLNKNQHRSIILAKAGQFWVYVYLFAKKDRANIDDDELAGFKTLAKSYGKMTQGQLAAALTSLELLEICRDS